MQETALNSDYGDLFPGDDDSVSIAALVSNVSSNPISTKRQLLQSISVTAAANVDDEVHLQKFHSDIDFPDKAFFKNRQWMRSKSTIETSKELMNRITRITSSSRLRHLQQEAYGKR